MTDQADDQPGKGLNRAELQRRLAAAEAENKALRQQAQAADNRFRQLLDSLPQVAVQGYSRDGTIRYWNQASEMVYGYSATEALGRDLVELIIPPEWRDDVRRAIAAGVETGEMPPPAEVSLLHKDGSRVPVFSSHAVTRGSDGDPELFCLDVALGPLRETEAALEESVMDYQSLSGRFLAVISATDELLACPNVDTLCRRAVELSRERLGLERVGLFLLQDDEARGTYGTDMAGNTTHEPDHHFNATRYLEAISAPTPGQPKWHLFLNHKLWVRDQDGARQLPERGWVVATPVQTEKRIVGLMFNDAAISHGAPDPARQDALEVFCSMLGNIIERKLAEEKLMAQVDLVESLLAAIPNLVFYKDTEGRYLGCNDAFAAFYGLTKEELRGLHVRDLEKGSWGELHQTVDRELTACPGTETYEARTTDTQGRTRITVVNKATFKNPDGSVGGVVGVVTDITEQKAAESALRESERKQRDLSQRLRSIIDITDILISCATVDEVCRQTVVQARKRLGLERCGLFLREGGMWIGTWGTDRRGRVVNERGNDWEGKEILELMEAETGDNPRWHVFDDNGRWEWNDGRKIPFGSGWGGFISIRSADRMIGMLSVDAALTATRPDSSQLEMLQILGSVVGTIIERKQLQQEFEAEHEMVRTIIDIIPDFIYTKDRESRFALNNAAHLRLLGVETQEEVVGKRDFDFFPAELARRYFEDEQELMATGSPLLNREEEVVHVDGKRRTVLSSKIPLRNNQDEVIGLVGITRDITDRMNLEDQLRQAEKLEAIGQLAGGIAHDFNNQLSAILGFADILKHELADNPELAKQADMILAASKRSAQLTKQLLAFARKGKYQSRTISIHHVINEALALLERSIDKRVTIRRQLEAAPDTVSGDPTQLQNAFMNLAINARDVLPDGGCITFATARVTLNQEICNSLSLAVTPGEYVRIDVADNGTGMDEATRKRIFEPFFTTKATGQGTGMGLASVYGTVKSHKGSIEVFSKVGQGTTFRIYLPVSREPVEEDPGQRRRQPVRGDARIMVVDDEDVVCEVARKMLAGLGYRVELFRNGNDAIAWYREHTAEFDLVILDMMMPELSGRDTYLGLREINPAVKAILSSGYTLNDAAQEILQAGVLGFIQKPFMLGELADIVAEALANEPRQKLPPPESGG